MKAIVQWVRSLWPFGGGHVIYPERRAGRRYLTLKNAARAAIILVVAFILLSLWSAHRPAHSGRAIEESRAAAPIDAQPLSREPVPVVPEGSTANYPRADSIVTEVPPAPPPPPPPPPARPSNPPPRLGSGQRIVISGGSEGVQVHVDTAPTPTSSSSPPSPPSTTRPPAP